MPTMFTFPNLPAEFIPGVEAVSSSEPAQTSLNEQVIDSAIERWRGALMAKRMLEGAR
jgi:hypothetical protein